MTSRHVSVLINLDSICINVYFNLKALITDDTFMSGNLKLSAITYKDLILTLKYLYIFFIFLLYLPALCFAQEPEYYFKNYQVSHGLSSNTVTAVTQDKKGFMWFGTRNGLNRFDGTAFKIYRNIPGDSASLGSNSILSLSENEQSELWVGT